jgi:uncharacterized repeat protein (TIGR03803 family)
MFTNSTQCPVRHRPERLILALCTILLGLLALAASAMSAQAQAAYNIVEFGPPYGNLPYSAPPVFNPVDSRLYGTCNRGGAYDAGTIYSCKLDGSDLQLIHAFNPSTEGTWPSGNLIIDSNGVMYGGYFDTNSIAAIFTFDGTNVTTFYELPEYSSGNFAGLAEGPDGAIWGTSSSGSEGGTIFYVSPDRSFVVTTSQPDGTSRDNFSAPVIMPDGSIYVSGSDETGDWYLFNCSFSWDSGLMTGSNVYSFLSTGGTLNAPFRLALAPDNTIYGTATESATSNGGVFHFNPSSGAYTEPYLFTNNTNPANGPIDGFNPGSAGFDQAGNLFVITQSNNRNRTNLMKFTPSTSTMTNAFQYQVVYGAESTLDAMTILPSGLTYIASALGITGDGGIYQYQPPVSVSAQLSPAPNAAGWNHVSTTLQLTGSGIFSITYTVKSNGVTGSPVTVTGSTAAVPFSAEGAYSVAYYGSNEIGPTTPQTIAVNVDTTPPVTYEDSTDNWVFLDGTDDFSGVAATYYTIDGGSTQTYTDVIQLPQDNHNHILTYWSVDVAGNVESQNIATVDTRADTYVTAQDVANCNAVSKTTFYASLNETDTDAPIANQTLCFSVAGVTIGTAVTNSSGQASLRAVLASTVSGGANTLTVSFAGDATQRPSQDTSTVNVSPVTTYLLVTSYGSVAHPIEVGTVISPVKANLESSNGGVLAGYTITYKMNGATIGTAVTASTNIASLPSYTIPDTLPLGANTLTATFAGTTAVTGSTGTATYYIGSTGTRLNPINRSGSKGSLIALAVTLTRNSDGSVLAGKTVSFTFNGHTYTATTTASGIATVFVTLPTTKGTYTYTTAFAGTTYYRATSISAKITVTN